MRVRIEVLDPTEYQPLETQDFPDLDRDQATMFTASLYGTVQAATEYLSWARDKPEAIEASASIADELYKRLRVGQAAKEAAGAEQVAAEQPAASPPRIRRKVARIGRDTGLVLEPLTPVNKHPSGLTIVGSV